MGPIRAAEFPVTGNFLYLNHAGVSPIPGRAEETGIRRKTLIDNLPESSGGARESRPVLLPALPDAIGKIRGTGGNCAAEVARSCREAPRDGIRGDGCP